MTYAQNADQQQNLAGVPCLAQSSMDAATQQQPAPSGYFCENALAIMGTAVDAVCKKLGLAPDSSVGENVAKAALWHVSQNAVDADHLTELLTAQFQPAMQDAAQKS